MTTDHSPSLDEIREAAEKAERGPWEAFCDRNNCLLVEFAAALLFERNRARALKGHLTRMKNRIANGVCPVPGCKRSGFANVMRHVAAKHPAWHEEHAHDLAAPSPGGEEQ